jgi:choline dehydrogenase
VGAWLRDRPEDYDSWEAAGASGWNAKAALDAFLSIEATDRGPSDLRGNDGLVQMSDLPTPKKTLRLRRSRLASLLILKPEVRKAS